MNTENEIKKILRAAPEPQVPDDLINKLQSDLSSQTIKTRQLLLHRWFIPTKHTSAWRIAAAIVIAFAVLIPLAYGATKLVRIYQFRFETVEYNDDGSVTKTVEKTKFSGDFASEEEAKRVYLETRELKKAGQYERTFLREVERNGVRSYIYLYQYTLSDGMAIEFAEGEDVRE